MNIDRMRGWHALMLALCLLILAACGGSNSNDDETVAPSITAQPASVTVVAGQTATFSVTAQGNGSLSYQWRRDGSDITGATGASYTTPMLSEADNGAQFNVVVSNSAGTATSAVAKLTAGPAIAAAITGQPEATSVVVGATATFSVVASGSDPLRYQWQRNGSDIAGADGASYTTPAVVLGDHGASFSVVVTNVGGSTTSEAALLTVAAAPVAPSISAQPVSRSVNEGQSASFSVSATGTAPLRYQWRRNGSAIAGATSASYTTAPTVAADNGARYSVIVSNGTAPDATSNEAVLNVTPDVIAPAITAQPASVTVNAGQSASFTVSASGTAPSYQWQRNGVAIAGATSSAYTTPPTTAADSGVRFAVVVSNGAGSVTSNAATLTVTGAPVAPEITAQPAAQSVTVGERATFSVTASGTAPLVYQWRRSGTDIAGAIAANYTTPATALADDGAQFSVHVSNGAGAVTSANAALRVSSAPEAPSIASQPADVTVAAGQSATFSITATGTAPLAYQWRRNGTDIAGATAASYTTAATVAADSGARFSARVSNSAGAATSNEATLTVNAVWSGIREDGAPGFSRDDARGVATDTAGNVAIAGKADAGQFSFDPAGLVSSAYVAKYSAAGQLLWAHKSPATGSLSGVDEANGVATDASGNIYVTGATYGTLPGQVSAGAFDVTVMKYDPAGNLLWARQLGSPADDHGRAFAVDSAGNAFVVGSTLGGQLPLQPQRAGWMFIAKYDTNGNRLWLRQWGADGGGGPDVGSGVALDAAGNAYMTGELTGNYAGTSSLSGSSDAFVAKYDSDGNQLWFSRLQSHGRDQGNAITVAADGNAIYFTGRTNSDFSQPGYPAQPISGTTPDVFLARLDGSGALQWVQNLSSLAQPGPTYFYDEALGIVTNAAGSAVFITGYTLGVMPTETSKGDEDIVVVRYESNGTRTWVKQFGADVPATAARNDRGRGITLDRNGDLFVVGEVTGTFGTPNPSTDRTDWFVMKLRPSDGSLY